MSDREALAALDQAARLVFEWRKGADVQDLILDMERIRQDIALRSEAAPPPLDGLDVETIAQIRHEDQEIDGNHCWHRNQHLAGRDCGEWAIRFAAEYAALRDEGETT